MSIVHHAARLTAVERVEYTAPCPICGRNAVYRSQRPAYGARVVPPLTITCVCSEQPPLSAPPTIAGAGVATSPPNDQAGEMQNPRELATREGSPHRPLPALGSMSVGRRA